MISQLLHDVQTNADKRPDDPQPAITKLIGPFITCSGSYAHTALYGLLAAIPVLKRFDRRAFFLLLWQFSSILVPFVGAHLCMPQAYITRYTTGASLAFFNLVGWGIRLLPSFRWRAAAVSAILVPGASDLHEYYTTENRAPWRRATHEIAARYTPGDLLILHTGVVDTPFEHYGPTEGLRLRVFPPRNTFYFEDMLDSLAIATGNEERVWYVESYGRDPEGTIRDVLERGRVTTYSRRWEITNTATGKFVSIDARLFERTDKSPQDRGEP